MYSIMLSYNPGSTIVYPLWSLSMYRWLFSTLACERRYI